MRDATVSPDPSRCPLCGADNRCAMEIERDTGVPQGPCWCSTQQFSEALLARLPAQARGKACICARCLAAFQANAPV
ncbi:MAG: cysteine-rich CWC family protein [Burkholderiaceae bacterium]